MVNVTIERPIALLSRICTLMDADGERSIALFDAPADRTFEPQIHADGRGWGKGRSRFY